MRSSHSSLAICLFALYLTLSSPAYAAHPLITDDTGTQGTGRVQIEVNGEYASDRETSQDIEITERTLEAAATFSYGITDTMDAVLGIPYVWTEIREMDSSTPDPFHSNEKGVSDISFELKWRFFEREGLSLALKPGISAPTGSERKGLGTGKYGASVHLIATQETDDWAFHLNLGYLRNNNRADEREDLYHASLAAEYRVVEAARIVVNIGEELNSDRTADRNPVFGLVGVIVGVTEDLDVDLGIKGGITDPETDRTVLAGMALRF